ncbi:MAG: TrkH family potassium uptake protein [Gemmatimonadota bacterium]
MNLREVGHIIGGLLMSVALAMLPSTALALREDLVGGWLVSVAVAGGVGALLWLLTPRDLQINPREALAVVGLGWIAIVVAGALPFLTTGTTASLSAALFESASGFTTTGATIFPVMEDLPSSILLWRSLSHFMGGMGIIVLGVAILPLLGVGGAQLFRAEAPGISTDRLQPRIATTARLLWSVYVGLTGALFVAYLVLGMSVFDAVNHALSTLATGGFSTRTASMAAFSPAIQWATILFMILAGVNFTLHYRMFSGNWQAPLRNPEWRWYIGSILTISLLSFVVLAMGDGMWSMAGMRRSLFNVVAIQSTTGFVTADFAAWPSLLQALLLGLMFVGAMGGSTGGGFKMVRGAVVAQHVFGEVKKVLHPRAVVVTRLGGRPIPERLVHNVLAFLALYMVTHAIGTVILAAMGSDLITALSASLAAISSIGPGLASVGPLENYAHFSPPALVTLSVLMLLGRLEFYTLLVLIIPGTWMRAGGGSAGPSVARILARKGRMGIRK